MLIQTGQATARAATDRKAFAHPAARRTRTPGGGPLMKATKVDVDRLRSVLKYLRSPESKLPQAQRLAESLVALDESIKLLAKGHERSVDDWLLAMVYDAHYEDHGRWRLHKPEVLNFALTHIAARRVSSKQ